MRKPRLSIFALSPYLAGSLVALQSASADSELQAQAFLKQHQLDQAAKSLQRDELQAIGKTLAMPNRRMTDDSLANLLRNPIAFSPEQNSRRLLGTLLKSLPHIAATEGINGTMKLAANHDASNFRGYGTEIVASAALNRYYEQGKNAMVVHMGSMIKGIDGKERESDGAALLGADARPRLVTIKSVSSINAVSGAIKKAGKQLSLRNPRLDGTRTPGVLLVGYDSPEVFEKLAGKNWQAVASRSGAKLLVLAIDQRTGRSKKLASANPDPNAPTAPQKLTPVRSVKKQPLRTAPIRAKQAPFRGVRQLSQAHHAL